MDRNTNLRDMDAPGLNSGKFAGDTILAPKGLATYPLPMEKGGNPLTEYTTPSLDKGGGKMGGENAFK